MFSVKNITFNGLMIAILVICSQISFVLPGGVPATLQTYAVALIAYLLAAKNGGLVVAVYLGLGFLGLPVFSNFGAGPAKLFGPTGGYLLGFLPMVVLLGISSQWVNKTKRSKYIIMVFFASTGLIICHLLGIIWLSYIAAIDFKSAAFIGSIPFIIKDIVSVGLGFHTAQILKKQRVFL